MFTAPIQMLSENIIYRTVYRRVQRFLGVLDAPLSHLEGLVEIDGLYMKAGLKSREHNGWSRSR